MEDKRTYVNFYTGEIVEVKEYVNFYTSEIMNDYDDLDDEPIIDD